jgi:beta-glucanase (GH16 family)
MQNVKCQIIESRITTTGIRHLLLLTIIAIAVFCGNGYGAYQLVWSDEFDGTQVNAANWSYQLMGDGGNNEWQYYTDRPANSWVANGILTIQANKEDYVVGSTTYHYTSARLRTAGKQDFLYGKLEARIKTPKGQGIWPAFWMMPTDSVYGGWAASGEIDIMESIGQADKAYGTLHYGGSWPDNTNGGGFLSGTDFSQAFHVYTIEWEPTVFRWYVDGQLFFTKTDWWSSGGAYPAPFNQRFHFILNVAVGGNWPGYPDATTVFPQQMQIDWIRVYQDQNPSNIAPIVSITSPANNTNVPAGNILIEATASDVDGTVSRVEFYEGANLLGQDTTSPYSFTWTSVPNGCYTITAKAFDDDGASSTSTIHITVGSGCGQTPYNGAPSAIPGTIQAEDFDYGGEGIAYHDTSAGNSGTQYRTLENVDIQNCTDTGGGYNIGWMATGEWLEYTVNVSGTGNYTLEARVAAMAAGKTFYVEFNGVNKTGNITVPNTGGWQNWTTVSAPVSLSAGTQIMRFVSNSADFNLNYIRLTATMVTVPNITGTTQVIAQSAITAAGLTVGVISQSFSNTVAAGNVMSQNPGGGTSAIAGSPVNLQISLGIRGDLNVDGTVDLSDVDIMAGEWLSGGVLADIEPIGGDGIVNLEDFVVLASNWGRSI